MPLINCKVELSLAWNSNCVLTSLAGNLTFTITDAKPYIPVVTSSIEDNQKLSKLLSEGFKRPVSSNKYKIVPNKTYNNQNDYIRELFDASYQGVTGLFVLIVVIMIESQLILTKDISFRELKYKIGTLKLIEEIFMISQLRT